MKKLILISFVVMLGVMMNSCKKETTTTPTTSKTPYTVKLTDAPGPYTAVYIDLVGVEITGNNGQTVVLNVNAGIYNLLNFTNGVDTLIATGSLDLTTVEQIRLILGPNNTVEVDSVSYPLSTPSADQSGLKLQVHQNLIAGVAYSVTLDFDANQSIVETGNGTYKLKPVIRTIETAISGAIKGIISPVGTVATVSGTSGNTYSTSANVDGEFLLMGLPAGTYSVTITPASPYNPVTQNNIIVTVGNTTDIGTIIL